MNPNGPVFPKRSPLTSWLQALLIREVAPCALGRRPPVVAGGDLVLAEVPYLILDPLDAGTSGPALAGVEQDLAAEYQSTVVAEREDQAGWYADKVRQVLLGRYTDGRWAFPLEVRGRADLDRQVADHGLDDPGREGAAGRAGIVTWVLRAHLATTPRGAPEPE